MESLPGAAPGEFARWLSAEAPECPLIIRYDFRSASSADVAAVALLAELDVRDSLRTHEDLRTILETWPGAWHGTATLALIRDLSPAIPAHWRDLVVTLISCCAREILEGELSAALGVSERTLRARLCALRDAGIAIPSFPKLNAYVVALNVLYWRERRGLHSEHVAERAGFSSGRACSQYVSRHVGASIAAMMRRGGFQRQVQVIRAWFAGAR